MRNFRTGCLSLLLACLFNFSARGQSDALEFPEGKSDVTLQLLRADDLLLTPVKINGRDVGLFIVDTGAAGMMIDPAIAQELGLPAVSKGTVNSGKLTSTMFAVDEVDIGGVKSHNAFVFSVDITQIRKESGLTRLRGAIGNQFFLSQTPFTLNWSAATLTLHRKAPSAPTDAVPVPLMLSGSRPHMLLNLGQRPGWFVIDTGASGGGLEFTPGFARLNRDWLKPMPWRPSTVTKAEGTTSRRMVRMPPTRLAGLPPRRFELAYSLSHTVTVDDDGVSGVIGSDILKTFVICFDYHASAAWFTPDAADGIPAEWSQAGFDPRSADLVGMTALMRAAGMGREDWVNRFLAAGAEINAQDSQKSTALHYAIWAESPRIVNLLLEAGATATARVGNAEATALHVAASRGQPMIVRSLLSHGAKVDEQDVFGRTPLIAAAESGDRETIELLIKAGSDLNTVSAVSGSAVNTAVLHGSMEGVRTLVEAGADLNRTDRLKTPLLYTAASEGHLEALKFLLDHEMDPNAKNSDGKTPLMAAADDGNVEVVRLLLDRGADPSIEDRQKKTAFDFAAADLKADAMKLLYPRRSATAPSSRPGNEPK
jgi:ankyrin repeat protein